MPRVIQSSESLVQRAVAALSASPSRQPATFEAILEHIKASMPRDAPLPESPAFEALIHKSLQRVLQTGNSVVRAGQGYKRVSVLEDDFKEMTRPRGPNPAAPSVESGEDGKLRRKVGQRVEARWMVGKREAIAPGTGRQFCGRWYPGEILAIDTRVDTPASCTVLFDDGFEEEGVRLHDTREPTVSARPALPTGLVSAAPSATTLYHTTNLRAAHPGDSPTTRVSV